LLDTTVFETAPFGRSGIPPGTILDVHPYVSLWPLIRDAGLRRMFSARTSDTEGTMGENENIAVIKKGFEAFNSADIATLSGLIAEDAQQHMPGKSQFAGDFKGRDAMLALYGQLGEASGGTFRAVPEDFKADGADKVVVVYQAQGERDGKKLTGKNTITFKVEGGKIADITDKPDDQAVWDEFWG